MSDDSIRHRADLDSDLFRLTETLDREVRSFGVSTTSAPAPGKGVVFAAAPEALLTAAIGIGAGAIWLVSALPY